MNTKTINREGNISKVKNAGRLKYPAIQEEVKFDIKPISARALVFNHKGELLVLKKVKNKKITYTCPGGHCECDETVMSTLVREFLEETGLLIAPCIEIARHYVVDKDRWRGNGFMSWWLARAVDERGMLETYIDKDYEVTPMWINVDKLADVEVKPYFMKGWMMNPLDWMLGPIENVLPNGKPIFIEEVYQC